MIMVEVEAMPHPIYRMLGASWVQAGCKLRASWVQAGCKLFADQGWGSKCPQAQCPIQAWLLLETDRE